MLALWFPVIFFGILFVGIVLVAAIAATRNSHFSTLRIRREFIQSYSFPSALTDKVSRKHTHLSREQVAQVFDGLRQYFLVCLNGRAVDGRIMGMPSKVVDEAWHEFILMTNDYMRFCEQAFGKYLHHSPHPQATNARSVSNQLIRTWQHTKMPVGFGNQYMLAGVPLLFAIDSEFKIPDGNYYSPDELLFFEKKRMAMASEGSDGLGSQAAYMGGYSSGSSSSFCDDGSGTAHSGCSDGVGGSDGGGASGCGGGGASGCGGGGGCGGGS